MNGAVCCMYEGSEFSGVVDESVQYAGKPIQAINNAFIVLGESLHGTQPEAPTAMGHTYSMWGSGKRSLHLYGWRCREVRTCGSPPVQDRYSCASTWKCDSNRC